MPENRILWNGSIHLFHGNALELYDSWKTPTVIISDGPYGVNGFPGDLVTPNGLDKWYEPHVKKWSELSTPFPRNFCRMLPILTPLPTKRCWNCGIWE